jgi:hypothetical protein
LFGFENVGRVEGVVKGVGGVGIGSDVEEEDEAGVREFENLKELEELELEVM